jgi:hypothetical protein
MEIGRMSRRRRRKRRTVRRMDVDGRIKKRRTVYSGIYTERRGQKEREDFQTERRRRRRRMH